MSKKFSSLFVLFFIILNAVAQQYPDSQKDGKYILVNGAKLWVVIVGKGDPLFIIPGGPGGAHISYRGFNKMAAQNMIVYFDAFGRGK